MAYRSKAILRARLGVLHVSSTHEYTVNASSAYTKFLCIFEVSSESSYLAWNVYVHGTLHSMT